jgi:glycerol-3-phosphate acyltransferase PlsY
MIQFFLAVLGGYLIGSISVGALIARCNGIAITQKGSYSSGATNVGRFLGIRYFFIVFLLDVVKAYWYLVTVLSLASNDKMTFCVAISLLLGNSFSIFLLGRGGKGVATTVGILLAIVPHTVPLLSVIWFSALITTRTVGIASVTSFLSLPAVFMWYGSSQEGCVLSLCIACFGVVRHAENIKRYFYQIV